MSALAEHPSTTSSSGSLTIVLGVTEEHDLLIEAPMDFEELTPALMRVPEEPEEDYPAGSGPFGF
jgi:hypothetical protein